MPHKYGAVKTTVDGIEFDSKAEARRYTELRLLEHAGEIRDLELQPRYELLPAFVDAEGVRHRAIEYVADFRYVDVATGRVTVEDKKGVETAVFKLKRKMLLARYRDFVFRVV